MSFGSPGIEQRLLPQSLEDRLVGWLGRAGGVALLVIVAAMWASLLTWSVADPSLTHATGGQAKNMLGAPGAIISDLLLQTLGFANVIALLAPMLWGLELAAAERIAGFRAKLPFYPLSILLLAGGLSALPVAASWPLHHGFGGILGDVVYNLAASIFAVLNPDRARVAAGFLFFTLGAASLCLSIGVDPKSLLAALTRASREHTGPRRSSWWSRAWRRDEAETAPPGYREPTFGGAVPPAHLAPQPAYAEPAAHHWNGAPGYPIADTFGAAHVQAFPYQLHPAAAASAQAAPDPREFLALHGEPDADGRAIAERFAPKNAAIAPGERKEPELAKKPGLFAAMAARRPEPAYKRPSLNLLKRGSGGRGANPELTQTVLRGNARLLEDTLADFGVKGEIKEIRPGPVVTLYELEPARGTKSARVIGLADDIARSMSVASVRVAVVPGRNAIGIELPNARRDTVLLREILEQDAFRASDAVLPVALGKSIGGEPIVADLARMPHLLVAGTTGSGKSVGVNAMILSLLYRHAPEDCRFLMIDPKMLELSVYNGIPHLLTPVVTDPMKAVAALNWVVAEMEERYKRMATLSVRNIDVFNNRVRNAKKRGELIQRTVQTGFDRRTGAAVYESQQMALEPMPYIVVVIDEFADLMIVAGKEIEGAVQRLAQMARAAGIHLIMATQRPSVDVITGTIKANFPTRISFKVASKIDSRTILNDQGAEQLLGQGDMLFAAGGGQAVRVHGPFVSDEEVESIAASLRAQGEPRYIEGITDGTPEEKAGGEEDGRNGPEDLYDRAVAIVLRDRKASTSYLQRRLGIGYNRAADLIERMEREGLISPANSVGKREILSAGASAA
jgi:S-DNA-T family DNA segregation ATPase FtsK/SpoIIIE